MWAILCVGVHGCFRSAELLEPAPEWRQMKSHKKENRLTINLEQSKTDPFREEVDRFVFATCDDTCPEAALRKLTGMQRARGSHTAVFAKHNGRPTWTRRQFVDRLKELVAKAGVKHPDLSLCSKEYAGHSMRRGGATSLAYRGIPTWLIKAIGHWVSDAFMLYIETASEYMGFVADAMRSRTDTTTQRELSAAGKPPADGPDWL